MIVRSITAFTMMALLLACQSCSSATQSQPLVNRMMNGNRICVEVPNPNRIVGVPTWNTPIGFNFNWYDNQSSTPVKIESVSLISPHNLILHRAISYRGTLESPNMSGYAWNLLRKGATASDWAHRQGIPGAVIPPQTAHDISLRPNEPAYSIVLDVSSKTAAGGYAIGQKVTYSQGENQYTIRSYTGYAMAPPGPRGAKCDAYEKAIAAGQRPFSASWQHGS